MRYLLPINYDPGETYAIAVEVSINEDDARMFMDFIKLIRFKECEYPRQIDNISIAYSVKQVVGGLPENLRDRIDSGEDIVPIDSDIELDYGETSYSTANMLTDGVVFSCIDYHTNSPIETDILYSELVEEIIEGEL